MRYWRIILIVFLAALMITTTACKNEEPAQPEDNQHGKEPPVQDTVKLSEVIAEYAIWQFADGEAAEEIITYQAQELPQTHTVYAVHQSEAVVKLKLKPQVEMGAAQLAETVKVEGATYEVADSADQDGVDILLRDIEDEVKLRLGDLERITLRRADSHLTYMLNQSALKSPYSLLIHSEEDGRSHIFVSAGEASVVLRFSEPMVRIERPGTQWLSDTQLRIGLDELEGDFPLDDYYSLEGNYVSRRLTSLKIHALPSSTWFDAASGGSVGWSERNSYYDMLIFSPDGSKYAGIVRLNEDEDEDGKGAYYGIVIEQRNRLPDVLEKTLQGRDEAGPIPVEWLNNHTLLYLSNFEIWAYDIETGLLQKVSEHDEETQTIAFQYDRRSGRLYALTQTRLLQDGREYLRGGLDIYHSNLELAERLETVSDLWPAGENSVMPLAISVQPGGYYMTTYRDGQTVTYYRANGEETYMPGQLIGVTDRGAYVMAGDEGEEVQVYWWPKGGSYVRIQSLPDSSYIMFGGDLFARREGVTDVYYGYSTAKDEWLEWSPSDGRDSWIPNQRTAYYRVTDG